MSTVISGPGADGATAAPTADANSTINVDLDSDTPIEKQILEQADKLPEAIRPSADDELFDGKGFEVKASIDGESADKIQIGFTGTDIRDPNNQADVDFFESLRLGRTVTLQVEAEVTKRVASSKKNKDDEETITGHVVLKIIDVYKPSPEEL